MTPPSGGSRFQSSPAIRQPPVRIAVPAVIIARTMTKPGFRKTVPMSREVIVADAPIFAQALADVNNVDGLDGDDVDRIARASCAPIVEQFLGRELHAPPAPFRGAKGDAEDRKVLQVAMYVYVNLA